VLIENFAACERKMAIFNFMMNKRVQKFLNYCLSFPQFSLINKLVAKANFSLLSIFIGKPKDLDFETPCTQQPRVAYFHLCTSSCFALSHAISLSGRCFSSFNAHQANDGARSQQ
jgi:hypothetical protein